jgi:hypothetical protein
VEPTRQGRSPGSIKGDVKKKHFLLRRSGRIFLTSSPLPAEPMVYVQARLSCGMFALIVAGRSPPDILVPVSSALAIGQPWFYLRLEAYCLIGLSEGAYGRS